MTSEELLKMNTMEIAKNPKLYKPYVYANLENETMETLLQHGRGVWLGQLCYWLGMSNGGTAKQKAERLMKWYNQQLEQNKQA